MAIERTYAMIKPDAVRARNVGKIIDMIEQNDFTIVRMEKMRLSQEKAEDFYGVHRDRPFFRELVDFITSGPVIAMVLEKDSAISSWRELMGATNPEQADPGTVRQQFGKNIGQNAVHGSDASETAAQEIQLIFPE